MEIIRREDAIRANHTNLLRLPLRLTYVRIPFNQMIFDCGVAVLAWCYIKWCYECHRAGFIFMWYIYFECLKSGDAQANHDRRVVHWEPYFMFTLTFICYMELGQAWTLIVYSHWGILVYQFLFQNHPT